MYNYIVTTFTIRGLFANSASFGTILTLAELTQESIGRGCIIKFQFLHISFLL